MSVRNANDVSAEAVKAGRRTTRQVLIGADEAPNFAMRKFSMEPGGGMPPHTNTVEHEQYVVRGSATIGIGDDEYDVRAGDVVYIPAGASVTVRTDRLPAEAGGKWINPRTGVWIEATSSIEAKMIPPDQLDWLLLIVDKGLNL